MIWSNVAERRAERAHDVLFRQYVNEAAVHFLRHEIAAVRVDTLLQHVRDLAETAADGIHHGIVISRLRILRLAARRVRDGRGRGLSELLVDCRLALEALDVLAERHDIRLHAVVGRAVFQRELAVLARVRVEKSLRGFPEVCAFRAKFHDVRHCVLLSSVQNQRETLFQNIC